MDLFDEAWVAAATEALAGLPEVEGADVIVDYVVSGAPSGKVTLGVTVDRGRVTAITPKKSSDPDLVISMKYEDAIAILSGEVTSDAGYMSGALKVEGAHPRWLLDLRPTRAAAIDALAPVMADTTT